MSLTAVGPFADPVEIDFAKLSESRLFLLDGPTGSGKSTIIDSLVFALYGKIASAATSDERMRSHFADPSVEPFVDLVFETSAGVFRVRRTPAFERPKKKGSGTTTVNAGVKLWRLSSPEAIDTGELLSNRIDEVADELTRIVGLNREQFSQTVVLPQGEFATFLKAPPEQRRAVLQKLFATEVYDAVAAKLEEQRRAARESLVAGDRAVDHALTAFITAASIDDLEATYLRSCTTPQETTELVTRIVKQTTEQAKALLPTRDKTDKRVREIQERLAHARALHGRLERQAQLLRRQKALDAGRTEHRKQNARLTRLRTLATAAPSFDGLIRARAAAQQSDDALAAACQQTTAEFAITADSADLAFAEITELLAALQPALEAETQVEAVRLELDAATKGATQAGGVEAELIKLQSELPTKIASLTRKRDMLRDLANTDRELGDKLAAARNQAEASEGAMNLVKEISNASVAVTKAHATAIKAEKDAAKLRLSRIDGIAGELASALTDGDNCPVCGATEHPHLAKAQSEHLSAEAVSVAEKSAVAARKKLESLQRSVDQLNLKLSAINERSGGLTPDEANLVVTALSKQLAKAQQSQLDLKVLDRELEMLVTSRAKIEEDLSQCKADLAVLQKQVVDLTKQLEKLDSTVTTARGTFATVAARAAQLRVNAAAAQNIIKARDKSLTCHADVKRRETDFLTLLAKTDFKDEAAFVGHLPDIGTIDDLASAVEAYVAEQSAVSDGLAAHDIANIDPGASKESTDLKLMETELDSAQAERDLILAQITALQKQAEHAQAKAQMVTAALADAEAARALAAPVIRMADLVLATTPDNLLKMPLTTYVLLNRFQSVVAAANDRLRSMSDGRYELAHSTDREDRGRKSGLGLVVIDHETEQQRNPATLSGGESFYTSLSLALGLADVVTAEAGGVSLGTLFIDEGFGSLDPDTLDDVLNEITKLRDGGRVVGVVSHVEELKVRIPDRVEVRRTSTGSSTAHVVC